MNDAGFAISILQEEKMIRRKFLRLITLSSAGALAPLDALASAAAKTIVFQVKGFTCITCAVGLDTMMGRISGVVSSRSTYPEGKVTVRFDPDAASENSIRSVITDAGFTITNEQQV
jgi:copper chaperone CopZ